MYLGDADKHYLIFSLVGRYRVLYIPQYLKHPTSRLPLLGDPRYTYTRYIIKTGSLHT